jgi:hypothetical protein
VDRAISQNKENRGLVERLTSLASSHGQTMDRLHGLEAQLQKAAGEKVSLESRQKKAKEDRSQVSGGRTWGHEAQTHA